MWLAFTDPVWRRAMVDWEDAAGRMVAEFRAAMAEHVAEPAWKAMVARLRVASPEFGTMWDRHEVLGPANQTKRFLIDGHVLRLDYTNLWFGPRLGTRLVVYTPADDESDVVLQKRAAARSSVRRGSRLAPQDGRSGPSRGIDGTRDWKADDVEVW